MREENHWKRLFAEWPADIPTRGVLISSLNEAIPFKAFMIRDDLLLLERTNADALNARFIWIPYHEINAVKLTDPVKETTLQAAGFTGKLSK